MKASTPAAERYRNVDNRFPSIANSLETVSWYTDDTDVPCGETRPFSPNSDSTTVGIGGDVRRVPVGGRTEGGYTLTCPFTGTDIRRPREVTVTSLGFIYDFV